MDTSQSQSILSVCNRFEKEASRKQIASIVYEALFKEWWWGGVRAGCS